jgi:hypothetical protein
VSARETADYRAIEFRVITLKLDALYRRQAFGDDTVRTRQRVAALEALQQAFMGRPEALTQQA